MAIHLRRIIVPGVNSVTFFPVFERALASSGYAINRSLDQSGTDYARYDPTSRALTWFAAKIPSSALPVILIDEIEDPAVKACRWDPELARFLSEETGGFTASVESRRVYGWFGFFLSWAGRTLEWMGSMPDAPDNAHVEENKVVELWNERILGITGKTHASLMWRGDTRLHTLEVTSPNDVQSLRGPAGSTDPLCRGAFAHISEDQLRAAARELGADGLAYWRIGAGATWNLDVPYVLVQAHVSEQSTLTDLARKLDVPSLIVTLDPKTQAFAWSDPVGGQQGGVRTGAESFINAWKNFSDLLTTPCGALVLPKP